MRFNSSIILQKYNDKITVMLGGLAFMLEVIPTTLLIPINHKISPFQNYVISTVVHSIFLPIWFAFILIFSISAIITGYINGISNRTREGRIRLTGVVFAYIAFALALFILGFILIHHRV